MSADELLQAWAAHYVNQSPGVTDEIRPSDVETVEFEGYIGCYSSWTCDWGVEGVIILYDGRRFTTSYGFSETIEAMAEFREQYDEAALRHGEYHGWGDQ